MRDYYHPFEGISDYLQIVGIGLIILVVVMFTTQCTQHNIDENKWNNGYCEYCEGHMVYDQAVGHKYETGYIYKCEKCGRTIELSHRIEYDEVDYYAETESFVENEEFETYDGDVE